ncbi:MAG: hypothetical protein R3B54_10675 [Bdellovibrionota bacterium]
MRLLAILTIIFVSSMGEAGGRKQRLRCEEEMARVSSYVIRQGELNHIVLPPSSKRFLIGILVEMDGAPLLALGGYRTQHFSLMRALKGISEAEGANKKRVLWMGELLLVNNEPFEALGKFTKGNEVAGLWRDQFEGKDSADKNNIHEFEKHVRAFNPELMAEDFEGTRWKDAKDSEDIRLMGKMNRFLHNFEAMKERGDVKPDETYRHFIRTQATIVIANVEWILEDPKFDDKPDERLAKLNALFEPELAFDSLYLYVRWLENDGYKEMSQLKGLLKRYRKEEQIPLSVFQAMDASFFKLYTDHADVDQDRRHVCEAQVLSLTRPQASP